MLGIDGHRHTSTLNLDHRIGNDDGSFTESMQDFSLSAEDITLAHDDTTMTIKADLKKKDGTKVAASLLIHEKIVNKKGLLAHKAKAT